MVVAFHSHSTDWRFTNLPKSRQSIDTSSTANVVLKDLSIPFYLTNYFQIAIAIEAVAVALWWPYQCYRQCLYAGLAYCLSALGLALMFPAGLADNPRRIEKLLGH